MGIIWSAAPRWPSILWGPIPTSWLQPVPSMLCYGGSSVPGALRELSNGAGVGESGLGAAQKSPTNNFTGAQMGAEAAECCKAAAAPL